MNKGTAFIVLVVVLAGGYGIGRLATGSKGDKDTASAKGSAVAKGNEPSGPGDGVDRVRVPLVIKR